MDDDQIVAEMVASDDHDDEESDEEEPAADTSVNSAVAFEALGISLHWLELQKTQRLIICCL